MGFVSFSDAQNDPDVAVNGSSSEIRTRRKHLLSIYTGRWRGVEEQPVGGLARVGPLFPDALYKDFCPYGFKWSPTGRIHELDIVLPECFSCFCFTPSWLSKTEGFDFFFIACVWPSGDDVETTGGELNHTGQKT